MSNFDVRFNCGEFRPGEAPVRTVFDPPTIPPDIIVVPTEPVDPFRPRGPTELTVSAPRWECVETISNCPPGWCAGNTGLPGQPPCNPTRIFRSCRECSLTPANGAWVITTTASLVVRTWVWSNPRCIHDTLNNCNAVCQPETCNPRTQQPTDPTGGGGGGPTTGGSSTGSPTGPVGPTTGERPYKCSTTILPCPPLYYGEIRRTTCQQCVDTGETRPPGSGPRYPAECIYSNPRCNTIRTVLDSRQTQFIANLGGTTAAAAACVIGDVNTCQPNPITGPRKPLPQVTTGGNQASYQCVRESYPCTYPYTAGTITTTRCIPCDPTISTCIFADSACSQVRSNLTQEQVNYRNNLTLPNGVCPVGVVNTCNNETSVIRVVVDPTYVGTGNAGINQGSTVTNTSIGVVGINQQQEPGNVGGQVILQSNSLLDRKKLEVIDIEDSARESKISSYSSNIAAKSIYSERFNFIKHEPSTDKIKYVSNYLHPNIFKSQIPEDLFILLTQINNPTYHWNEKIFYNLTDELLADSITTDLLYAFNNIHFYGGQIVPASHFIKALKKLIFTGRVSDFDPEYYINLANKHIQDKKITFVESEYKDFMEQAALGIISTEASPADYKRAESSHKENLKRYKPLNEDVEASVYTNIIDGEPALDTGPSDSIDIYLFFGDSLAQGIEPQSVSALSASPEYSSISTYIPGVYLFQPSSPNGVGFEEIRPGVNTNLLQTSSTSASIGPEITYAYELKNLTGKNPHIIKLGVGNSYGASAPDSNGNQAMKQSPLFNNSALNDWDTLSTGELFDIYKGWIFSAVSSLSSTYGMDRLCFRGSVTFLGTNYLYGELVPSFNFSGYAGRFGESFIRIIQQLTTYLKSLGIYKGYPVFIWSKPDERYELTEPFSEIFFKPLYSNIRREVDELAATIPNVVTYDPPETCTFWDSPPVHYDSHCQLDMGKELAELQVATREKFELQALKSLPITTDGPLFLKNAGISILTRGTLDNTITSGYNDGYLNIGDGAEYYVSSILIDSNALPLVTDNALSSTYYTPPSTRWNAMSLFKEDGIYSYRVKINTSASEFDPNFDNTPVTDLLYFALDLSSLVDVETVNPLVIQTTGLYKLLTDPDLIKQHTLNYGMSIAKLNLDYRDTFLNYAKSTSAIEFTQGDINFRAFSKNRTFVENALLCRNIPFGLIVTPGNGSKHNPFAGQSTLDQYTDDQVVRSVRGITSISYNDNTPVIPQLDNKTLGLEKSTYQVGLVEIPDTQARFFDYSSSSYLYNSRFYTDKAYTPILQNASASLPVLANISLNVVDRLINEYNPDYLTYWDVFRRLTLKNIGELFYEGGFFNFKFIDEGWRGVKIREVLSKYSEVNSGLNNLDTDDTTIILKESDR